MHSIDVLCYEICTCISETYDTHEAMIYLAAICFSSFIDKVKLQLIVGCF